MNETMINNYGLIIIIIQINKNGSDKLVLVLVEVDS